MDGNAGRGGKKRAKAKRNNAAVATQEPIARAATRSSGAPAGAASAGKKQKNSNAAVVSSAKVEKKTTVVQSQSQQQQQADQTGKKKKKKRRLHAGAVAAKAAAKAAEAAAAHAVASSRASAGENKATDVVKSQGGAQKAPAKELNTRKQTSAATPKATVSPRTRSSLTAASSLKPVKKKQKLGSQQQQVIAQEAPKKKKKQQQTVQPSAPILTVQMSIPKPKNKVKRKIEETAQQVSTPTTQPAKLTIRPPAAKFTTTRTHQESVGEPVAKKPKMVVLNRRSARASSELPVVVAAAVPSPPLSPSLPVAAEEAAKPATPIQATDLDSSTQAADVTAPLSSPAAEGKPDAEVSSAIPPAAPEPEEASQATVTTVTQDATHDEESVLLPLDAVVYFQEAILPAQLSPVAHQPQSPLPKMNASPNVPAVHEEAFASHEEALVASEEETEAVFVQQPESIEVISLTNSDSETEDDDEDENMEPFYESEPSSPEQNDLLEEWLGNTPSPPKEFEGDDAFLQPEPEVASSEVTVSASNPTSPVEHVDPALNPSHSVHNIPALEIVMALGPSHSVDEILEIPVAPSEVVIPPLDTIETAEPTAAVVEEQQVKYEVSHEDLELDADPEAGSQASSPMLKSEEPLDLELVNSHIKSEEPKSEEPKPEEPVSSFTAPLSAPPVSSTPVQQTPPATSSAPLPISTEPSYRALLRDLSTESELCTPPGVSPQPRWSEKKRSWGASFGMASSSSIPDSNSSAGSSSLALIATPVASSALMTSPLSSWFLSKGHANFVQQVSFPPRPANDRRRRSLSPRKQLISGTSTQIPTRQHGLATQQELVEVKRYIDDEDEGSSTGTNAFLESLALCSNWRTWYGNVDKRDLLDPPLQHVPADVQQAVDSANQVTENEVIVDSASDESRERRSTSSSSIEQLEAEIRAEKVRARAFDQELLLMLRGDMSAAQPL